ncbi:MAG: YjbQ family protein [Nitrososphaeraceae archaeon]
MFRSTIVTNYITLSSEAENDIINITNDVERILLESHLKNGIITLFIVGSTAAITTIEYEPGLKKDFPRLLERIAPKGIEYEHDNTWHDGNGHSQYKTVTLIPIYK